MPPKKVNKKPKIKSASPNRFGKSLRLPPKMVRSMDEANKGLNRSASPKRMKPKEQHITRLKNSATGMMAGSIGESFVSGLLSGPRSSLATMTVKPKKTVEIPIKLRTH